MYKQRLAVSFAVAVALSGCGSIMEGVAKAVINTGDEVESMCQVEGPASHGLAKLVRAQAEGDVRVTPERTMKVLMVHGIGEHKPGYSRRLRDNLMDQLGLNVRYGRNTDIPLVGRRGAGREGKGRLGNLRLSRYLNESETHKLIFYELTWSESVEQQRRELAFDTSGEYASRRTGLNNAAKRFFNARVVDPMMYLGNDEANGRIRESVRRAMCFMSRDSWERPRNYGAARTCSLADVENLGPARNDDFVFITHSLGSAIVVDALEAIVSDARKDAPAVMAGLKRMLRDKEIKVYMLANQLRLLKLTGNQSAMDPEQRRIHRGNCWVPDTRHVRRTAIYAFSDPNDILSYEISPNFADKHLDPRLCATVTNITLNVARPTSFFGLEFANPEKAHSGYDNDRRVIALIADGIGSRDQSQIKEGHCRWVRSKDPEAGKLSVAGEVLY